MQNLLNPTIYPITPIIPFYVNHITGSTFNIALIVLSAFLSIRNRQSFSHSMKRVLPCTLLWNTAGMPQPHKNIWTGRTNILHRRESDL